MQPGYIPWIGFFELMYRADIFLIYDTVKFDKNGWRNRNQIKTPSGSAWLTVPVHSKNEPLLSDILIDNKINWRKKHLKSIELSYKKSKYFGEYFPQVEKILNQEWKYLNDLNLEFIKFIALSFKINTTLTLLSKTKEKEKIEKLDKVEKLIKLCQLFKCNIFYEPAGGKSYLEQKKENFNKENIKIIFQEIDPEPYSQLSGKFIPNLSSLDLLFNKGENGRDIIIKSGEKIVIN